jgi:hypothetical protein
MRPVTTIALAALFALATTACKKDKASGSPGETNPPAPVADERGPPATGAETTPAAPATPAATEPGEAAAPATSADAKKGEPAATATPDHKRHRHEPGDPYYCEMHPEETAQEAGAKCPVCQMEMVARKK